MNREILVLNFPLLTSEAQQQNEHIFDNKTTLSRLLYSSGEINFEVLFFVTYLLRSSEKSLFPSHSVAHNPVYYRASRVTRSDSFKLIKREFPFHYAAAVCTSLNEEDVVEHCKFFSCCRESESTLMRCWKFPRQFPFLALVVELEDLSFKVGRRSLDFNESTWNGEKIYTNVILSCSLCDLQRVRTKRFFTALLSLSPFYPLSLSQSHKIIIIYLTFK